MSSTLRLALGHGTRTPVLALLCPMTFGCTTVPMSGVSTPDRAHVAAADPMQDGWSREAVVAEISEPRIVLKPLRSSEPSTPSGAPVPSGPGTLVPAAAAQQSAGASPTAAAACTAAAGSAPSPGTSQPSCSRAAAAPPSPAPISSATEGFRVSSSGRPADAAPALPGPHAPAATAATPFAAAPGDLNLRRLLKRWATQAGFEFRDEHWAVARDIPIVASADFGVDFKTAVRAALEATEYTSAPARPCFYANRVLRVVPRQEQCARSSRMEAAR